MKTCLWPRRYLTRVFIYSTLISSLVTIKMKFSLSIASSLHSLGILALEISDNFNFAFFLFASLPHRLFSPRWLKPLQKSWRSRGIPIAIFLDDGLGGGADHISAKLNSFPNEDKSLWEPVQIIAWLGVILNTIDGSIKTTDDRIVKLTTDLGTLSRVGTPRKIE